MAGLGPSGTAAPIRLHPCDNSYGIANSNSAKQSMVSWQWPTFSLRDGQLVPDHSCRLSDNTRRQFEDTPCLPMESGHPKWGHCVPYMNYSPVAVHENHINRETHGHSMYCLRWDYE